MIIQASANARKIEAAFGVNLSTFRYGNTTFYSSTAEAQVPASIGSMFRTIVGLHNSTFVRLWVDHKSSSSMSDPTYGPADIRTAYDDSYLVNNLGYTGTGQTIDILDAYDYANLFSDLYYFDSTYSLPNPPSAVKILVNSPSTCPSGSNACVETSMDTEWAHVMAPGASLHIVLVPDLSDNSLEAGIDYVVNHDPGIQIFSNSWGTPEMCSFLGYNYVCDSSFINAVDPLLLQAASQGISTFFSSGDTGAYVNGVLTANYPASDPWVTGVGGTRLNSVSPRSETAWSVEQCASGSCSSGGGVSQVYGEPAYQSSDFSLTGRGVPDVSADADPYTGVQVYCTDSSCPSSHWFGEGGTSLSAPLWAGNVATLNQAVGYNLGFLNPLIYALYSTAEYSSDFHDITSGNNGYYSAGVGYDLVTGLGSPDLFKFAQNRGMIKVSASPSTVSQGQSVSFSGSGFTPGGSISSCISTGNVAGVGQCVAQPNAGSQGNVAGSMQVGTNIPPGPQKFWVLDASTSIDSNAVQLTITSPVTVTVTATVIVTSTVSSTSYITQYTTTTVMSYTSTSTSTSTIPTLTTVVLVPLTVTTTAQSTQYLTSFLTTTVTSYTGTQISTSTIPTTVALVPLTMTSTVQSTQLLTYILTTTVTSYTGTQASTSTIVVPTTVVLVPSTVTSTVQSTEYLTSILTTTVTSYTGTSTSTSTIVVPTTVTVGPSTSTITTTQVVTSTGTTTVTGYTTAMVTSYTGTTTSTSTIPTVTTVVLVPLTVTSTAQSTQYLTSTTTTTVTSYTATTTSTSTSVVYTTVTATPGGSSSGASSSPVAYLGFISLLALTVGHEATAGKGRKILKVRSLMKRRCLRT
jgi:hypothetical protein